MLKPLLKSIDRLWWVALLIAAVLLADAVSYLTAEGLWFAEVDYLPVFWLRVQSQLALGLIGFSVSALVLVGNLAIAHRRAWTAPPGPELRFPGGLRLRELLPLTVLLGLALSGLLLYYGRTATQYWRQGLNLRQVVMSVPNAFNLEAIATWGTGIPDWGVGETLALAGVGALAVVLIAYSRWVLPLTAALICISFGLVLSQQWTNVLPAFNAVPFNRSDPLFDRDLSFYLFQLPVWELLEFWLLGLLGFAFVSVLLVYLLSGDSLSQGRFPGFTSPQRRHLDLLGAAFMLVVALSNWLDRYRLLYSPTGAAYGASFTSVTTQLPAYTGLSLWALAIALMLGYRVAFRKSRSSREHKEIRSSRAVKTPINTVLSPALTTASSRARRSSLLPTQLLFTLLLLYAVLTLTAGFVLPTVVQQLIVQPNELLREAPYIQRTIALTREGFALNEIEEESFNPTTNLTLADLDRNDLTIDNIRLWDTRPLLETNRQLQRFRPYYEFAGADIDRYTLPTDAGASQQQQVLIAARELDYSTVPPEAQTWVNQHLIYTHGYGFTLSPVNTVGEGGLPDYFIQGIEHTPSSDRIRDTIPIAQPRIYYGELTNTYVMTHTRARELDYPSGSDNVYNTYDGSGGIPIGSLWRRLLFAKHLRDWQMLLTEDFTANTRVLFRRSIDRRIQTIAPFLRYDHDPYLVVADVGEQGLGSRDRAASPSAPPSYLYWIIDAYTTSDRYPYSDPGQHGFNYIRNSVKVVVDAYHGSVRFFVADDQDPIIQTWSRVFPGMFEPLSAMPIALRTHIRYPQDFYQVQSEQLMVYHMTDSQVFYNREDLWRAPNEIYGSEPRQVEPYYLIMRLPNQLTEEFLLFRPFTPDQRTNLIAWLAARSDGGPLGARQSDRPGRMLLYRFSKQNLVFGTEQIEARINQDPVISQQISLWNRQGSRAIQGNLLVIPIEDSLLYVEPLYLEAEQNQLPTFVRVIVAYGNRIVMAETLEQALAAVFQSPETDAPAIVRPVEETVSPEEAAPPTAP